MVSLWPATRDFWGCGQPPKGGGPPVLGWRQSASLSALDCIRWSGEGGANVGPARRERTRRTRGRHQRSQGGGGRWAPRARRRRCVPHAAMRHAPLIPHASCTPHASCVARQVGVAAAAEPTDADFGAAAGRNIVPYKGKPSARWLWARPRKLGFVPSLKGHFPSCPVPKPRHCDSQLLHQRGVAISSVWEKPGSERLSIRLTSAPSRPVD
jgi:hypothetical protein